MAPHNNLYVFNTKEDSKWSLYANMMAYCFFNSKWGKEANCFEFVKNEMLEQCNSIKEHSSDVCTKIVTTAATTVCQLTTGVKFCDTFAYDKLETTSPPETSFSIGTLCGGCSIGVFFGFISTMVLMCMCRKKFHSNGGQIDPETGEKQKKNKKNKIMSTSGTTQSKGTSGTTGAAKKTTQTGSASAI